MGEPITALTSMVLLGGMQLANAFVARSNQKAATKAAQEFSREQSARNEALQLRILAEQAQARREEFAEQKAMQLRLHQEQIALRRPGGR